MNALVPAPDRPVQRPAIDRRTIPFDHWSMKVGRRAPALGEIVDQIEDLEQGIANLLFTPKGSVPTEPEKGCDLILFMDRPPAIAIPALVTEIWDALADWHPRIVTEAVSVEPIAADERGLTHFTVPVFWHPVEGVIQSILSRINVDRDGLLLASRALGLAA